ncbi:hypothetical protein [Ralstonia pseudosolanacearum]|uniref:hypothetical protein n=1 Tax=Ralstonia pseudosolanacearum TaxID=1310165 RepID=UPI001FF923BD|nr:hypothetical protein [Ralstonia pseudosolanacearum]
MMAMDITYGFIVEGSATTSTSMFFRTNPKLLRPIHSLLDEPFDFAAGDSIAGPLRKHLAHRADFDSLVALGRLYDRAQSSAQRGLIQVRPLLEESLSVVVRPDTDLRGICQTAFTGETPRLPEVHGARYLSYVSVQCQLERLYDHLGLRRMGMGSALQKAEVVAAVRFLMLNEALVLCLAGLAKVFHHENRFDISVRDAAAQETLHATWFARALDQSSRTSTLAMIKALVDDGAMTVRDLTPVIEKILDQDLAIPWRRLTDQGRALKSVQHLYGAVAVVGVVAAAGVRGETVKMTRSDLLRYGLDFSEVSGLVYRQTQALVTDQFVTRKGDTLCLRIEAASKGLRRYYRALELEFGERDVLRTHIGGFFFEKTHIRHRIEHGDDYKPRYQVLEGFDQHKVLDDAPNQCDIEFIIRDVQQRHYYFIHVKHSLLGEEGFFKPIVEAIQDDIGHGIFQLREAKRLLEANRLCKTLAARDIEDATPENCSFVLLHNIAQFDFQSTEDGIALYDWATFRNLLKDAECRVGRADGEPEPIRLRGPLLIDHPMTVIRRLLAEHPVYCAMNTGGGWSQERAATEYALEGKTICVSGLGI